MKKWEWTLQARDECSVCKGVLEQGTFDDQWIYYSDGGTSWEGELDNKGRGKKPRKQSTFRLCLNPGSTTYSSKILDKLINFLVF